METVVIVLFASGGLVLIGLGLIVLFYGISADEAEEFPFWGKSWPRPVAIISLLSVSLGWPVILKGALAAWIISGVFIAAAVFMWYRGRRD